MAEFVSPFQVMNQFFEQAVAEIYTALPCRITNIPSALEDVRIDVQPLLNTLYEDGTGEEHSQIMNVPVIFPAGKSSMISWPLEVGDVVLCVFAQGSLDTFKQGSTSPNTPSDARTFDSRDAVAIPGFTPFSKTLNKPGVRSWAHSTKDLTVAHNIGLGTEVEIRLKPNGDLIINTEQNVTVNCATATVNATASIELYAPSMTVQVANTTWNGNIVHTGDYVHTGNYTQTGIYTLDGIVINTHEHTDVTAGLSRTGGPV